MAYSVSTPNVDSAAATLVRLWTDNLPVVGDPHAKFRWYDRDNPIGVGHAMLLSSGETDVAVGCGGIGIRRLFVNGTPIETALLADLAVDKAHRTLMPALVLTKALRNYCREHYQLTYGFPNKHAEALFKRIGSHFLGRYTRYALVLRSAAYIGNRIGDKFGGGPRVAQSAGWVADASLRIRRRLRPTGVWRHGLRLDWADTAAHPDHAADHALDNRLNQLWAVSSHRYAVMGYRGADFVRWRFLDRPNGPAELALLVERDSSVIRGYAAVERDGGAAHVVDLLAASDEDETALLTALAREMYQRGCTSLSLRFLGSPSFVERLLNLGFRPRDSNRAMILEVGDALQPQRDMLHDLTNWYILDGDEDS